MEIFRLRDLLPSSKTLKLPVLGLLAVLSGCKEQVANLIDNDDGSTFNFQVLSTDATLKDVPYETLESVVDSSIPEDKIEGREVGIFLDEEVAKWHYEKGDTRILISPPYWCNTALPAANVYAWSEGEDFCAQDVNNCSEQDCSDEAMGETYSRLFEESQREEGTEDSGVGEI